MRVKSITLAALVPALLATAAFAACPTVVKDTMGKSYPGAKVVKCATEKEHGMTLYEVKIKTADGKSLELDLEPEGKILKVEEDVRVQDVPAAIRKAFDDKHPKTR